MICHWKSVFRQKKRLDELKKRRFWRHHRIGANVRYAVMSPKLAIF